MNWKSFESKLMTWASLSSAWCCPSFRTAGEVGENKGVAVVVAAVAIVLLLFLLPLLLLFCCYWCCCCCCHCSSNFTFVVVGLVHQRSGYHLYSAVEIARLTPSEESSLIQSKAAQPNTCRVSVNLSQVDLHRDHKISQYLLWLLLALSLLPE